MDVPFSREEALDELIHLHSRVDRWMEAIVERHRGHLRCDVGCSDCCVDGLTVFEVEAERIRQHGGDILLRERPHRRGACAFLGTDGSCRVYEHRPYVCRTQGAPLRWLDQIDSGELVEMRDVCPINDDPDRPLVRFEEEDCWTIGGVEGQLAGLQARWDGGELRRVTLRSLFPRGRL